MILFLDRFWWRRSCFCGHHYFVAALTNAFAISCCINGGMAFGLWAFSPFVCVWGGGGFWALCACLSIYFCAVLPFFVIADGVPYHLWLVLFDWLRCVCGCCVFAGPLSCVIWYSHGTVDVCVLCWGVAAVARFSIFWCCFSVFGVWLCSVSGSAYVPCIFPGFGVVFSCLHGNLGHWRMFGSCVWGLSFLSFCVLFSALGFASCLLGDLQPNENHIRYQFSNPFEPIYFMTKIPKQNNNNNNQTNNIK